MHEQLPFTDVRKSDSKLAWAAPIYRCEQKGWRDDEQLLFTDVSKKGDGMTRSWGNESWRWFWKEV